MKKIIVIGGGFTGINVVKQLQNKNDLEIILFDYNNYHLFQPLLYQVAMAGLNPGDIATPLRSIFSGKKNIKIYLSKILDINKEENKVTTDFGTFYYDYLVIACGSTTHYFGNDHWREYTLPMKSLNDARKIRNLILTAFEEAEKTEDPIKKEKLLTFTIIGGGPTGVELAGSLAEMCKHTMSKDFKNIKTKDAKVILIERSKYILATYNSKLSKKAQYFLERLGVQVRVDESVVDIKEGLVKTSKTTISSSTIIWAAGIKPSDIGIKSNLTTNKSGKILVNDNLLVKGTTNIFAGGDIAYVVNNDKPLPAIAPVAMQEGIYIGKYIKALLEGKKMPKFKYKNKGLMATIGRNKAVAQIKKFKFAGIGAWVTWIFVHIYYLTGFKNKFAVLFGWAWSYITYKKGTRIILK